MSLKAEMLRAAGAAPALLREARDRVAGFLRGQFTDDGGARGRDGQTDLYYTAFALQGLVALDGPWDRPRVAEYLLGFGDGEALDLVHRAALARARACAGLIGGDHTAIRPPSLQSAARTAYGAFLAYGCLQDLGVEIPDLPALTRSIESCRSADGGYANTPGSALGGTAPTAAAVAVLRDLGEPVDPDVGGWLLGLRSGGGFLAAGGAAAPDLLSTAVALHALARMGEPLDDLREPTLDFADSLWSVDGGFLGHWGDDVLDCEYTFYGLLALGHLAGPGGVW